MAKYRVTVGEYYVKYLTYVVDAGSDEAALEKIDGLTSKDEVSELEDLLEGSSEKEYSHYDVVFAEELVQ